MAIIRPTGTQFRVSYSVVFSFAAAHSSYRYSVSRLRTLLCFLLQQFVALSVVCLYIYTCVHCVLFHSPLFERPMSVSKLSAIRNPDPARSAVLSLGLSLCPGICEIESLMAVAARFNRDLN